MTRAQLQKKIQRPCASCELRPSPPHGRVDAIRAGSLAPALQHPPLRAPILTASPPRRGAKTLGVRFSFVNQFVSGVKGCLSSISLVGISSRAGVSTPLPPVWAEDYQSGPRPTPASRRPGRPGIGTELSGGAADCSGTAATRVGRGVARAAGDSLAVFYCFHRL